MDNIFGYIYETTNLVNNKKYIGKKVTDSNSDKYIGSGVLLIKAIKKYGRENFIKKIIDVATNNDELTQKEIYWIDYFNAVKSNQYYNICKGGEGGDWYSNISEEKRLQFIEKCKNRAGNYNHSEETKDKIRKGNKGRKFSDESKKLMSIAKKKSRPYARKKILQLTIDNQIVKIFDGIIEAAEFGFSPTKITACCKGKNKTHKNYKWVYYEIPGTSLNNIL
jgi:group I intron endonuclease